MGSMNLGVLDCKHHVTCLRWWGHHVARLDLGSEGTMLPARLDLGSEGTMLPTRLAYGGELLNHTDQYTPIFCNI